MLPSSSRIVDINLPPATFRIRVKGQFTILTIAGCAHSSLTSKERRDRELNNNKLYVSYFSIEKQKKKKNDVK